MTPHIFEQSALIHQPLEKVFDFFSKAENLNLITPPELAFKILSPLPIEMKQGTIIDYRIQLNGIPFHWKTEISAWEAPHRFVDRQLKGPYILWVHEHRFKKVGENLTEMTDRVEYLSPGWLFEPLVHQLFVKRKVEKIFDYRKAQLEKVFKSF